MTTDITYPIQTDRLLLRPHTEADAAALQPIYANPDVARFLLDDPWTEEVAREKVAERLPKTDLVGPSGAVSLVIEFEGAVIGDVQLWITNTEWRIAEVGWVLDPRHSGKGFAAEAVRAIIALGFERGSLHRVVAQMDARNLASAKLASRVGMHREAHLRQDWWNKGEWTDTVVFGLLAGDRQ
ncbi:GNAT family N-acetyltransferase [Leucobacter komagatae]|uniref:Acetyltransferase n=1 Tax=Leucobacter komagatae TaxID=55969 RepID=A0A0D0IJB4_9MICO|nr:GNAT family N-acetyltransferase [Leucobacter komagatae]KIP51749.1 acetyltransferase [Leucobacter komagatae]